MLQILLGFSMIALLVEYLRMHLPLVQKGFLGIFGFALRSWEQESITGATYVFVGMSLTVFLFPGEIAIPAILVLTISDALAALVGVPFGHHPFLSKSLEGSMAFFLSALAIILIFSTTPLLIAIIIAAGLATLEAAPKRFDDNFLLPLTAGVLLLLATLLPLS